MDSEIAADRTTESKLPHSGKDKTIAKISWGPVFTGAGLAYWGGESLSVLGAVIWFVGIIMQLFAGSLHFIKMWKARGKE